jgi:hypothetical protein
MAGVSFPPRTGAFYVTNLPFEFRSRDIRDAFERANVRVALVDVAPPVEGVASTCRNNGTAIVCVDAADSHSLSAMRRMNGQCIGNRTVIVASLRDIRKVVAVGVPVQPLEEVKRLFPSAGSIQFSKFVRPLATSDGEKGVQNGTMSCYLEFSDEEALAETILAVYPGKIHFYIRDKEPTYCEGSPSPLDRDWNKSMESVASFIRDTVDWAKTYLVAYLPYDRTNLEIRDWLSSLGAPEPIHVVRLGRRASSALIQFRDVGDTIPNPDPNQPLVWKHQNVQVKGFTEHEAHHVLYKGDDIRDLVDFLRKMCCSKQIGFSQRLATGCRLSVADNATLLKLLVLDGHSIRGTHVRLLYVLAGSSTRISKRDGSRDFALLEGPPPREETEDDCELLYSSNSALSKRMEQNPQSSSVTRAVGTKRPRSPALSAKAKPCREATSADRPSPCSDVVEVKIAKRETAEASIPCISLVDGDEDNVCGSGGDQKPRQPGSRAQPTPADEGLTTIQTGVLGSSASSRWKIVLRLGRNLRMAPDPDGSMIIEGDGIVRYEMLADI